MYGIRLVSQNVFFHFPADKGQRHKIIFNLSKYFPVTCDFAFNKMNSRSNNNGESKALNNININDINTKASYLVKNKLPDTQTFTKMEVSLIKKGDSSLRHQIMSPMEKSFQNNSYSESLNIIDIRSINTKATYLKPKELLDDFNGSPDVAKVAVKVGKTENKEQLVNQKPPKVLNGESIVLISDDEDDKPDKTATIMCDMKIQVHNPKLGTKADQPISCNELSTAIKKHKLSIEPDTSSKNSIETREDLKHFIDTHHPIAKKTTDYIELSNNLQNLQVELIRLPKDSPMKRKLKEVGEDKKNNSLGPKHMKTEENLKPDVQKDNAKPFLSKIPTLGAYKKKLATLSSTSNGLFKCLDLTSQVDTNKINDFSKDDCIVSFTEEYQTNKEEEVEKANVSKKTPINSKPPLKFIVNYHDFSYVPHFSDTVKDLKPDSVEKVRIFPVTHTAETNEFTDSVCVCEPPDIEYAPAVVNQSVDNLPVNHYQENKKIKIISNMVIVPQSKPKDCVDSYQSFPEKQETLNQKLMLQQRRSEHVEYTETSEQAIDKDHCGNSIKYQEKMVPSNYISKDPRLKSFTQKKLSNNNTSILKTMLIDNNNNQSLNDRNKRESLQNLNRKQHSVPFPTQVENKITSNGLDTSPVLARKFSAENHCYSKNPDQSKKGFSETNQNKPYQRLSPITQPSMSNSRSVISNSMKEFSKPNINLTQSSNPLLGSPEYKKNVSMQQSPEHKTGNNQEDNVDMIIRHIAYYIYIFNHMYRAENQFRNVITDMKYQSRIIKEDLRACRKFYREINLKQNTELLKQMAKVNIASRYLNYKELLDQVLCYCKQKYNLMDMTLFKLTNMLLSTVTHNSFTFRAVNDFTRGFINHLKNMVQQIPSTDNPFLDRYCICGKPAEILCPKCKCVAYCELSCQKYYVECHETYCSP